MHLTTIGRCLVARPQGEIDLANAMDFKEELVSELDSAGHSHLILDLADVHYMDSTGVRVLFDVSRRLENKRGRLAIALPTGSPLERLFKITHVSEAALVCGSLDDCIECLAGAVEG